MLQLQCLGNEVDVTGEDLERQCLRVDALRAPLSALVDVEEAKVLAQRVEVGPEHRVVHPRPAVEHEQRDPLADLLDVDAVAVAQADEHAPERNVGRTFTI